MNHGMIPAPVAAIVILGRFEALERKVELDAKLSTVLFRYVDQYETVLL